MYEHSICLADAPRDLERSKRAHNLSAIYGMGSPVVDDTAYHRPSFGSHYYLQLSHQRDG